MDQVDTKGAWCHQDIEEIEKQEPGRGSENGSSRDSTGIRSSKFQSRAPPFNDGRSPSRRTHLERTSPRSVGFCFGSKANLRTILPGPLPGHGVVGLDRKSTRLNSSH